MRALVLLFVLPLLAGLVQAEELSFEISGNETAFVHDATKHMTLSKECEKEQDRWDCQAYSALSKASLRGVFPQGGASPGAVMCASKLGGEVVIGRDRQRNENSFCRFDDGSMVSCGSLTYYGRKNDLKKVE